MLPVTGAAALIAIGASSSVSAVAVALASLGLYYVLSGLTPPRVQFACTCMELCVCLLVAARHVPALLLPVSVLFVLFPSSKHLSMPVGVLALLCVPLMDLWHHVHPASTDVLHDLGLAACVTVCMLGDSLKRNALTAAWGILLYPAPRVLVAIAAVQTASENNASAWEYLEKVMARHSVLSTFALRHLFVLLCACVAAASSIVPPLPLASLYAFGGFSLCTALTYAVVLRSILARP